MFDFNCLLSQGFIMFRKFILVILPCLIAGNTLAMQEDEVVFSLARTVDQKQKGPASDVLSDEEAISILTKPEITYGADKLGDVLMERVALQMPPRLNVIMNTLSKPNKKHIWPHFIVLVGKPGVGKSTMARYVAQKLGWRCEFIKAAMVADEYQNSGSKNLQRTMKDVFEYAKNNPIVVIFDEINSVTDKGSRRHNIDRGTATAFWCLLDECLKKDVVIIGTTNTLGKQQDQITSRAGGNIIEMRANDDIKFVKDTLLSFLPQNSPIRDNEIISAFAEKVKKLNPRVLEQLCHMAEQNSLSKKENSEIVELQELEHALIVYRKSQNQKEVIPFKKKLKKFNKNYVPLIGLGFAAVGTTAGIILFYPQLKSLILQNKIAPEAHKISEQGLKATLKGVAIAEATKKISEEALKVSEKSVVIAEQARDISQKSLEVARDSALWQKAAIAVDMLTKLQASGTIGNGGCIPSCVIL